MHYDFTAIPDADVPQAAEPVFRHVLATYASEANKTASVWRAVPDGLLDFKPDRKSTRLNSSHEMLHAGQIGLLRRQLGYPPLQ